MECAAEKKSYFSKQINLLQYARILLCFHLITILTVIIDFIPCITYSGIPKIFHPLLKALNFLFTFQICSDIKSTIISSILVVWTFITAVIIFYMEKKDNLYCGMRVWDIVSHDISKKSKRLITVLFFFELFLILTAAMIDFSVTLAYFCGLYTLTPIFTFWFISWATTARIIREQYFSLIAHEYSENKEFGKKQINQQLPILFQLIDTLPFCEERELDTLLDIILTVYLPPCRDSDKDARRNAEKAVYLVLLSIKNALGSDELTKNFFRSAAKSAYNILKEDQNAADILSAISFPLLASSGDASHYMNFVSVIPESKIQKDLIIRGAVYTVYLDKKTSYNRHVFARKEILGYFVDDFSKESITSIIDFAEKINDTDPDNNILADVFEQILRK